LVSGIPFIRYAHSQTIGFWNIRDQIRSKSNDWFLEYPSSDTLKVKRLVSGIPFIRYAQSQTIGNQNSFIDIPELDLNSINLFVPRLNLDFLSSSFKFIFFLVEAE
jgi:hypothetical protein